MNPFDEQYFERGVATGVSGYTNYHWKPEYFMKFANTVKQRFDTTTVLDYGCAKGFLVKALRMLDVNAVGYDISTYAVEHCDPAVKGYLTNHFKFPANAFSTSISKDVLEHIPKDVLPTVLKSIADVTRDTFIATVPLGDDGRFRIREYELDKTHVNKEDELWWINQFRQAGFGIREFHYDFPGAKDHWIKSFPHGNGTFVLSKLPYKIDTNQLELGLQHK